jgi:hypothetical protein
MTWTMDSNAELLRLHRQGYPETFIASWMKLDRAHVRARLEQLGLVKPTAGWRDRMPSARSFHELYRRAAGLGRGTGG